MLELSWAEASKVDQEYATRRTAYVGWDGGSSNTAIHAISNNGQPFSGASASKNANEEFMEMETALGQGLGLAPGQQVNVNFVTNVETGKSVDVTPFTTDDWEILVRSETPCKQAFAV